MKKYITIIITILTSLHLSSIEGLLTKPVVNYITNFMVSGFKFVAPDRSTPPVYRTDKKLIPKLTLIRPYHWSLIHSNH